MRLSASWAPGPGTGQHALPPTSDALCCTEEPCSLNVPPQREYSHVVCGVAARLRGCPSGHSHLHSSSDGCLHFHASCGLAAERRQLKCPPCAANLAPRLPGAARLPRAPKDLCTELLCFVCSCCALCGALCRVRARRRTRAVALSIALNGLCVYV